MPQGDPEGEHSLASYYRLVRSSPGWRILWIGEILSSLGNWFAYIATLLVVERLADGSGILLSVVLIMRFLPSLFLFPVAGVFADRYNRVNILITSCLLSAAAAATLPVVQRPQELWLLFVLLFLEFGTQAFYDPARRALTPSLVPRTSLHLATTLDSFAWSLTGAIGASLGGLAASKLSVNACFYLDAATYLWAAACNYRLKALMPDSSSKKESDSSREEKQIDIENPAAVSKIATGYPENIAGGLLLGEVELQAQDEGQAAASGSKAFLSDALSSRQNPTTGGEGSDEEADALLGDQKDPSDALSPKLEDHGQPEDGCWALVSWSMKDGFVSLKEGWSYVWNPFNRDVLALTVLKAAGALVWGAADVLNVRFSELPEMQSLGDAAFTLGVFFASVGGACLLGPLVFNTFTPPKAPNLLVSAAVCYLCLVGGYLGMAVAGNVYLMCLSIVVRSFGSAVLWVYSTLLIQLRVPDSLLGRMMALEMAFFTVAESLSGLFGGIALDDLGLTTRQVSLVMAILAAAVSCVWLPYAIGKYRRAKADLHSGNSK